MISTSKQYKCPICGGKNPIDVRRARMPESNEVICAFCSKRWKVAFRGQTCCKIMFLFASVEDNDNIRPTVKLISFNIR
ncbi:hypothetical protein DRN75_04350 [Nanoarchaeota archaeon]|nr:MAG: hypothetical protein DRN75_04350 [Nanoarchaeota archaeon]